MEWLRRIEESETSPESRTSKEKVLEKKGRSRRVDSATIVVY